MKKIILLLFIPYFGWSQKMLTMIDENTGKPVNGVKLTTFFINNKNESVSVADGDIAIKWNKNQTPYDTEIYERKGKITFTMFSKDGYQTATIKSNELKEKNYVIKLMRDKIHDDYYVKLFEVELKFKLNETQLNKLQSDIAVEGIEEIKKRDGHYSYITHKVNDIHLAITQLKRIKDYKHPLIEKPYLLHTKNKKVYFRLQFGVISHTPLENLIPQYSQMLKGVYSITPVLTVDKYHRIVSVQEYNNFTDAQADFLQKLTFQNPSLPAVAIAYEKDKTQIDVISQLRIK